MFCFSQFLYFCHLFNEMSSELHLSLTDLLASFNNLLNYLFCLSIFLFGSFHTFACAVISFMTSEACGHNVMVSKIQWKPFWLAIELYYQNDWTGWQFCLNDDIRICTGPIVEVLLHQVGIDNI